MKMRFFDIVKITALIAAAAAAAVGQGGTELKYVITGSGTAFTAAKNGEAVATADQPIQTVIDAIKADANKTACTIQFGNGTDTLDIDIAQIIFNGGTARTDWGLVTLSGSIKSANAGVANTSANSNGGVIRLLNGVAVESGAHIINTSTANNSAAVYNSGGTMTVTGGAVSASGYYGIYNYGGTITVADGAVLASNYGISNLSGGTITMTGGSVSAAGTLSTHSAITHSSTGAVTISGGTVQALNGGMAIRASGSGKVTISGTAQITARSTRCAILDSTSAATVEIAGGKAENTSTGSAVDVYGGALIISGGEVLAASAANVAVYCSNITTVGGVTLNNDPDITGSIRVRVGDLRVSESGFSPGDGRKYNIDFNSYSEGAVAVRGGANYRSNFTLVNQNYSLGVSGSDLLLTTGPYAVTRGDANDFTLKISDDGDIMSFTAAIDTIKAKAGGENCSITFGDGVSALNLNNRNITFNGGASGGDWGNITLLGKLTSAYNNDTAGLIYLTNGVSIDSKAEITNTSTYSTYSRTIYSASRGAVRVSGGSVTATAGIAVYSNHSECRVEVVGGKVSAAASSGIYNNSAGEVEISGGEVAVTTGYAVNNRAAGAVTISGGTVSATGTGGIAVYNYGAGLINVSDSALLTSVNTSTGSVSGTVCLAGSGVLQLNMSGGTVRNHAENTGARAIQNSTGTVNISGGTVSATLGRAIQNATGTVNISGGIVSANSGYAVYNSGAGSVTVSGSAVATSKNLTASQGTVYLAAAGGGSFNMTGGKVENTNDNNANARAVYRAGNSSVTISGGTVSVISGYAVYNNVTADSAEPVIISGGKVLASAGYAVYNAAGATVEVSGGLVFAYGSGITGVGNVINGGFTEPSGLGVVVAWDSAAGGAPYQVGSDKHIYVLPASASVGWSGGAGTLPTNGIAYRNGANSGTIELGVALKIVAVQVLGGLKFVTPAPESAVLAGVAQRTVITAGSSVYPVRVMALDQFGSPFTDEPQIVEITVTSRNAAGADFKKSVRTNTSTGIASLGVAQMSGDVITFTAVAAGAVGTFRDTAILVVMDAQPNVSVLSPVMRVPVIVPLDGEAAVLAPVSQLSGEFTAGPNPAAKQSGSVKFYRQGKRAAACELRIYDAAGNIINKVKIRDMALNSHSRRQVGSWDFTDMKGRPVSEGAYLVRGTLKTAGGSEKISLIIVVR